MGLFDAINLARRAVGRRGQRLIGAKTKKSRHAGSRDRGRGGGERSDFGECVIFRSREDDAQVGKIGVGNNPPPGWLHLSRSQPLQNKCVDVCVTHVCVSR